MQEEVRGRVLVDAGKVVEAVQDRREEEPRQEQRLQEVLDVAVERVERRDREREAGDDAREERAERDREPDRVARLGDLPEAQHDDDAEHHREAHEVRADDRERDELAREAHLADEVRVLEEAPRRRLRRRREEHPRGKPAQEEEPVVVAPDLGDAPEHREDEQVDEHEDERVQERPSEPEDGAAVLRADVAPKEAPEELAIANYVGVNGHAEQSRATGWLDYPFPVVNAIVAIAAFSSAVAVLWLLLRSPVGARLVAVPSDERWHEQPTPTFGGVGIFAGFVGGRRRSRSRPAPSSGSGELGGILAGVTIVFVAGLVDDLRHLSPIAKLAAQITAAVVVLASGLNVEIVGNDVLAWAIGLLWLVGITNAFNLLDNMDGLAATLAIVSCAYFAIDALTEHENETVLALALALGLACAGFLPFNLRPRRGAAVFMGDSGSLS